jgi:hypothetical protein
MVQKENHAAKGKNTQEEEIEFFLSDLIQSRLLELKYKGDLRKELVTSGTEKNYSAFLKQLIEELKPYREQFEKKWAGFTEQQLGLCPDIKEVKHFKKSLLDGAFKELVRHAAYLEKSKIIPFLQTLIEKQALLSFEKKWANHQAAQECYLAFLAQKTGKEIPLNFGKRDLFCQSFEQWFKTFFRLFQKDFQHTSQKWPEDMRESHLLPFSWEVFQTFLRYSKRDIKSYRAYLRQIIKTRSINLTNSYSPVYYQLTCQALAQLEAILAIELPVFISKRLKQQTTALKGIPETLNTKLKQLKSQLGKIEFSNENKKFCKALNSHIISTFSSLINNKTWSRKDEFLKEIELKIGRDLTKYLAKTFISRCTVYKRNMLSSLDDAGAEQENLATEEYFFTQIDSSLPVGEKYREMLQEPEKQVAQKDTEAYKDTFISLLEQRPFEEQFLLKRKAEYKKEKQPKSPKYHELEHPQRRSFDEILELVRMNPSKYRMFYQYFRSKAELFKTQAPNLENQEFYPQYFYQMILSELGLVTEIQENIITKTRVPALYKINQAAIEALDREELPDASKLTVFVNRQFENLKELFQFLKLSLTKSAITSFKERLEAGFRLKKKEAMQLKRSQLRNWAERIMAEMRRAFLTIHPETDVQISDLLIILHDEGILEDIND